MLCGASLLAAVPIAPTLPGTRPFSLAENWQEQQRLEIQRHFERRIEGFPGLRQQHWPSVSMREHRVRFCAMLGIHPHPAPQARVRNLCPFVEEVELEIEPCFSARGLLFRPAGQARHAATIALPPDAQTAEAFAGVAEAATPAHWLTRLMGRGSAALYSEQVRFGPARSKWTDMRLTRRRSRS